MMEPRSRKAAITVANVTEPCFHCGIPLQHGTMHGDGRDAHLTCLDALWRAVWFAVSKEAAIEALERYGRARFALGFGEGIANERLAQQVARELAMDDVAGAPD